MIVLILITFFVLFFFPQVEPTEPVNIWHIIWAVVVPIIVGLYEVIVRIIPTVGNYSFIGKIIEIFKWLSDFLNNKKKK